MDVSESASPAEVDEAARIWAEATAARDGHEQVATLAEARPLIRRVLDSSPRSRLLIAREGDGTAIGFAAVESCPGASPELAELRYLGVTPNRWGGGAARLLLVELAARLRAAGFSQVVLSVYVDNARACRLYEAAGWMPDGAATPHPRTGKPERRYRLALGR